MNALQSFVKSAAFQQRAALYLNAQFVGPEHANFCALNLCHDLSNMTGAASMLLRGDTIALAFPEEDTFVTISRGDLTHLDMTGATETFLYATPGGYVALHEGKISVVEELMARLSPAASDQQQAQDRPLLH